MALSNCLIGNASNVLSLSSVLTRTRAKRKSLPEIQLTDHSCKAPICDDIAVNNALTALGTYAALHNETWFKTRRIAYIELLPKAPYLSKYCDLALADLPEFIQAYHLTGKKARLTDSGRGFEDVKMRSSMLMDTEE